MIKVAFFNILRRKSRTVLSLVGIVIGVAAIIGLVSIVDGMYYEIKNVLSQLQGVNVSQKGASPLFSQIDESFEKKLESIQGVKTVVPQIISIANSVEGKKVALGIQTVRLIGYDIAKQKAAASASIQGEIIDGRDFKVGDKGVVIIGKELKENYNKFVGNKIKINGKNFKIIGVYETGAKALNSSVLFPLDDLRNLISFPNKKVSMFNIKLRNPALDKKIVKIIKFRYGDELQAFTASSLSEQFGEILGSMRLLVLAIAAVSAIVAGVGIINTMLMSVVERFKEIGALKAVGWTNGNVMKMILYESMFIGMLGGIVGMGVGYLSSLFVQDAFGLSVLVTPTLLAEAFAFALFIGLFAGVYPAYTASKMDPVEALRME